MAATPIVAYGSAVRAGYANSPTACTTGAGGTQLKNAASTPVPIYCFALQDEASGNFYFVLAGDATENESSIYGEGTLSHSFAAGQYIYLTAQSVSPTLGGISTFTAGWYVIALYDSALVYISSAEDEVLAQPTACKPNAAFAGSPRSLVARNSVTFTDQSTDLPTSWLWTLPGGTPDSSTAENPVIIYNDPGVYAVTLKATNAQGNDTEEKNDYITVNWNDNEGKATNPEISKDFVINTYKNMTIQRTRTINQIPFSLGTKGAPSLRGAVQAYSSSFGGDKNP